MDYQAFAQQTTQEILGYYQDTSGWKVIKTSVRKVKYVSRKKITVSSKASKKFHGNLYRVEGVIPESTSRLSDFLYRPENRVTWDKSLKVYNMVQKIDSVICCLILDFYCINTLLLLAWISPHILHLQITSVVTTMLVAVCVHLCKSKNPAHSKLVMFVQTEMRGRLAPSIIEATMPSHLVSFILNAKDGIKTHKIPSRCGCHHNGHSSFLKK
ncbi:StAR-related lipid transfer protein 6 [Camelus dromedarius]|uniref:StAR-related lipid transfer protein 6 n=1 Tax=Camelus dromedarius TaxID=9838 RepID=A0A5N4CBP0_CAMDR|nr:StAR-related lipid transfer protein 6 [Camelus dromedarius]